jgi:hypothetical protein
MFLLLFDGIQTKFLETARDSAKTRIGEFAKKTWVTKRHEQILRAHEITCGRKNVIQVDDSSFVLFKILHGIFYKGKTPLRKKVWRNKLLKISHGLDGQFDFNTMLLIRIPGNKTPFTKPAIRPHSFLLINRINGNDIMPHLLSKIITALEAWAKRFSNPMIHLPLVMWHAFWLLPL